jgi:hypothetical protein
LVAIGDLVGGETRQTLRGLAYEDFRRHQEDAASTREALLIKFARWLARWQYVGHWSQGISRDDLYHHFLRRGEYALGSREPSGGWRHPRDWCEESSVSISSEQLAKMCSGPVSLVREMKRLKLLPTEATHTRDGDRYVLDEDAILGVYRAYLGDTPAASEAPADAA